ncbi:hypothetical protein HMPREF1548_05384 [Clostridium sp. KLE 1755]|nr:hypothetical protein HMPREF1548_05384 [Clostridium sp. KLE 1755]
MPSFYHRYPMISTLKTACGIKSADRFHCYHIIFSGRFICLPQG